MNEKILPPNLNLALHENQIFPIHGNLENRNNFNYAEKINYLESQIQEPVNIFRQNQYNQNIILNESQKRKLGVENRNMHFLQNSGNFNYISKDFAMMREKETNLTYKKEILIHHSSFTPENNNFVRKQNEITYPNMEIGRY